MRKLADNLEEIYEQLGEKSLIALLETMDRKVLIDFAKWNDPNGVHSDAQCMQEFGHTFPTYEYRQHIYNAIVNGTYIFGGKDDSPKPYVTIYGKHVRVTCGEYSEYYTLGERYGTIFVEADDAPQWVQEFLGKHWEVV
jgi:hypothetical protein